MMEIILNSIQFLWDMNNFKIQWIQWLPKKKILVILFNKRMIYSHQHFYMNKTKMHRFYCFKQFRFCLCVCVCKCVNWIWNSLRSFIQITNGYLLCNFFFFFLFHFISFDDDPNHLGHIWMVHVCNSVYSFFFYLNDN